MSKNLYILQAIPFSAAETAIANIANISPLIISILFVSGISFNVSTLAAPNALDNEQRGHDCRDFLSPSVQRSVPNTNFASLL